MNLSLFLKSDEGSTHFNYIGYDLRDIEENLSDNRTNVRVNDSMSRYIYLSRVLYPNYSSTCENVIVRQPTLKRSISTGNRSKVIYWVATAIVDVISELRNRSRANSRVSPKEISLRCARSSHTALVSRYIWGLWNHTQARVLNSLLQCSASRLHTG